MGRRGFFSKVDVYTTSPSPSSTAHCLPSCSFSALLRRSLSARRRPSWPSWPGRPPRRFRPCWRRPLLCSAPPPPFSLFSLSLLNSLLSLLFLVIHGGSSQDRGRRLCQRGRLLAPSSFSGRQHQVGVGAAVLAEDEGGVRTIRRVETRKRTSTRGSAALRANFRPPAT